MVCVCPAGVERVESSLCRDEVEDMGKELVGSVSRLLSTTHALEQDRMEGVEEKEWDQEE